MNWRLLLVLSVLVFQAPSAFAQSKGAQLVGIDAVSSENSAQTVPVIGRLLAKQTGAIAALVAAPVKDMPVDVGDAVKRGDVIAVLASDSLKWTLERHKAGVRGAIAALNTAKAQRTLRHQELKRIEDLKDSSAFSPARQADTLQQVAMAESAVLSADAALARARAEQNLAQIALDNTQVRAPYDGVISQRHVDTGVYLRVGDAVVTLIDNANLEIEVAVPSVRIKALTAGKAVRVDIPGIGTIEAAVRAVVPEEDPRTRTQIVRLIPLFEAASIPLAANRNVTAFVPAGAADGVLTVHKDAVLNRGEQRMVFIVKDGKAEPRNVTLGQSIGVRFEVLSGLEDGDQAVIRGNERLRPGQAVRINDLAGRAQ